MRLAINLNTLTFVNPENIAVTLKAITMRRNDVLPIELSVIRDGKQTELPDAATGTLQLNEKDTFGGAGLGKDSSFAKTGTGRETLYTFDLDLSGAAVDMAFTSDPATIEARLEVKIDDGTHITRSEPLVITLQNAIS